MKNEKTEKQGLESAQELIVLEETSPEEKPVLDHSKLYVWIADAGNNRIQKFDASGKFVKAWGSYGTTGGCACLSPPGGKFDTPRGLDVGCKRAGKTTTGSVGKKRYWKKRHVMKLGVATVKLDR